MYMQTWIFQKADIPEATEEVEAFAVKLMKHGVSLKNSCGQRQLYTGKIKLQ